MHVPDYRIVVPSLALAVGLKPPSSRASNACKFLRLFAIAAALISPVSATAAGESITYSYDALGRLVIVNHGTTGPNANVVATYSYDRADNRCNVVVSTTGASGAGTCGSSGGSTALTLSPTVLANGTTGTGYSQTITASGGTGGYTFTTSAGTLPAGVALSSSGVLSGTPTTASTYSFTIKAIDSSANTGTQAYSVAIAAPVVLTLSPAALPNGTAGTAYSQIISASGGTGGYSFTTSAGVLPTGLTLSSSGVLSGTLTTAATYSFTIKAIDSASHTGTQAYSVTVAAPVNHPPVANTDMVSTTVCQQVFFNPVANDTDPDGDLPLSTVSVSGAAFTLLSPTEVEFSAPHSAGQVTGSYVVQDSRGAQATGTIIVAVGAGSCTLGGGLGISTSPTTTTTSTTTPSGDPASGTSPPPEPGAGPTGGEP